ncbi:MAG: hypothetical protein ACO3JL_18650 [Myxococcota bacterium]
MRRPRRDPAVAGRLMRALGLAQAGDAEAALAALEEATPSESMDFDEEGLRFVLLQRLGREDDVITLIARVLAQPMLPLSKSTWHLRRGLLHLSAQRAQLALQDLQEVLKLAACPDHEEQARLALLRAAELLSTH